MRLTTKSEYALLALLHIARHSAEGQPVRIQTISEERGIPAKYLEQLLRTLARSGYVKARRGVGGGYRLALAPEKIDIASVIRLLDGPLAPSDSVSRYFFAHTPLEQEPRLLAVMREIRNYIARRLERLTLADLI